MSDQLPSTVTDAVRLSRQREAILDIMGGSPGPWMSVPELVSKLKDRGISCAATGASATLRDLRKPRYGGHQIDRKQVKPGLWTFRIWRNAL